MPMITDHQDGIRDHEDSGRQKYGNTDKGIFLHAYKTAQGKTDIQKEENTIRDPPLILSLFLLSCFTFPVQDLTSAHDVILLPPKAWIVLVPLVTLP